MDSAPKEVKELVERFASNIEDYKRQGYNESQVLRKFIDPFFEALGWDISNKKIDNHVYELYGLTPDEIEIVKGIYKK